MLASMFDSSFQLEFLKTVLGFVCFVTKQAMSVEHKFSKRETNSSQLVLNSTTTLSQQTVTTNCTSLSDCVKQFSANSVCLNKVCKCAEGFLTRHTAVVSVDNNDSCVSKSVSIDAKHMLPIMIVMGVMFVGICIALNLFSKSMDNQQQRAPLTAVAAARAKSAQLPQARLSRSPQQLHGHQIYSPSPVNALQPNSSQQNCANSDKLRRPSSRSQASRCSSRQSNSATTAAPPQSAV